MNDIAVVYHKADFDGICSGEVIKKHYGDKADYIGWDYKDPVPDLDAYKKIYLIDLSFPKPDMEKYAHKMTWIDHHASAIKSLPFAIRGLRIDGVAACRLGWQWFFGDHTATKQDYVDRKVKEPYSVQMLGEYDIWDKRNPDTDIFQVGLGGEKVIDWDAMFKDTDVYRQKILDNGQAIWNYLQVTNKSLANERGFDLDFEGLKFRALNIARSNSLTFKDALDDSHDGCFGYYWNGKMWSVSLYGVEHKKDLDLSKIAIKYGGGGHKQACGFTLKTLPKELGGQ